MGAHRAELRPSSSGNKKGRNDPALAEKTKYDQLLKGRLESSHFFSTSRFSTSFFAGALGAAGEGFEHGGFTVGGVVVPGVEGTVGTVPPPAAAPKRETEAKSRAAENRGFFMTWIN